MAKGPDYIPDELEGRKDRTLINMQAELEELQEQFQQAEDEGDDDKAAELSEKITELEGNIEKGHHDEEVDEDGEFDD